MHKRRNHSATNLSSVHHHHQQQQQLPHTQPLQPELLDDLHRLINRLSIASPSSPSPSPSSPSSPPPSTFLAARRSTAATAPLPTSTTPIQPSQPQPQSQPQSQPQPQPQPQPQLPSQKQQQQQSKKISSSSSSSSPAACLTVRVPRSALRNATGNGLSKKPASFLSAFLSSTASVKVEPSSSGRHDSVYYAPFPSFVPSSSSSTTTTTSTTYNNNNNNIHSSFYNNNNNNKNMNGSPARVRFLAVDSAPTKSCVTTSHNYDISFVGAYLPAGIYHPFVLYSIRSSTTLSQQFHDTTSIAADDAQVLGLRTSDIPTIHFNKAGNLQDGRFMAVPTSTAVAGGGRATTIHHQEQQHGSSVSFRFSLRKADGTPGGCVLVEKDVAFRLAPPSATRRKRNGQNRHRHHTTNSMMMRNVHNIHHGVGGNGIEEEEEDDEDEHRLNGHGHGHGHVNGSGVVSSNGHGHHHEELHDIAVDDDEDHNTHQHQQRNYHQNGRFASIDDEDDDDTNIIFHHGDTFLQYGYYFFLRDDVDAQLYAQTEASAQAVPLLLRRQPYDARMAARGEKEFFPLTGVPYVVVRVSAAATPHPPDNTPETASINRMWLRDMLCVGRNDRELRMTNNGGGASGTGGGSGGNGGGIDEEDGGGSRRNLIRGNGNGKRKLSTN